MRLRPFYFLALLLFATTACTAQINVVSASKGNTGNRGIEPRDAEGNHIELPKGKDYYALEMKAKRRCTVELISLFIKTDEGNVLNLTPTFTDGDKKKNKMTADLVFYIRAEVDDAAKATRQNLTGEGLLKVKINGKAMTLPIENFTLTLPR